MKTSRIEIKERTSSFVAKGFCWLLFACCALFFALLPFISEYAMERRLMFFLIGGGAFVFFASMFFALLLREMNPASALVLNSHGFCFYSDLGDTEIEWTNVASVEIINGDSAPVLGVTLENPDMVIAALPKKAAQDMQENIAEELPHVLIVQSAIRYSVYDLKLLFERFIREARALEENAPKEKVNPFTTDDVMRAFGRLPDEDEAQHTAEYSPALGDSLQVVTDNDRAVPPDDDFYSMMLASAVSPKKSKPIVDDETPYDASDEPETSPEPEQDTVVYIDADSDDESDAEEEMPEELLELIGKARSSKIDEIERILSSDKVTHRVSHSEQVTEQVQEVEESVAESEESREPTTKDIKDIPPVTEEEYPDIVMLNDLDDEDDGSPKSSNDDPTNFFFIASIDE